MLYAVAGGIILAALAMMLLFWLLGFVVWIYGLIFD